MIIRYNSTITIIMASTLSQADLLEIYKAEGGGKSSWHDGRAPINLTTQEWCLLLWQDYKYKPIHDRQICLGKSNIFCTNVSLISLSSQYIWTKNECTISVHFMSFRWRICRQQEKFRQFGVTFQLSTQSAPKCSAAPDLSMFWFLSYIELLILQVFEIEIFLHHYWLTF